ncbi:HNH endonuclease [Salinigranum sp. GCM10025319]|uniref:HNH endonuclease n=1 Tax=Salinigranum sp. GCM10025319 TaxID=3252687 RepID=UPI0036165BC4
MKLGELDLDSGTRFTRADLDATFDRGMTGRGIEICYDEEDQRYLRLFSKETGPYADDVTVGQFTYIGEGRTGDQTLTAGNKVLASARDHPLPIFFFYKRPGDETWEYEGLVDVVDYRRVYHEPEARYVFEFTIQRREESTERVDAEESTPDITRPDRVETTRSRVIRNTTVVRELKKVYGHGCQLCGDVRHQNPDRKYAEGHHLQPLGRPHEGPDTKANLLVLCPNHHADFDYGMVSVDPETWTVAHAYEHDLSGTTLTVASDHPLEGEYLAYHNRHIADF